jgi:hypothetical protein
MAIAELSSSNQHWVKVLGHFYLETQSLIYPSDLCPEALIRVCQITRREDESLANLLHSFPRGY